MKVLQSRKKAAPIHILLELELLAYEFCHPIYQVLIDQVLIDGQ
ncbi:hypothetical protein [Bacillus rubiinfantis]|nr:hypothetical protein [Bacillus rubiinfantis]